MNRDLGHWNFQFNDECMNRISAHNSSSNDTLADLSEGFIKLLGKAGPFIILMKSTFMARHPFISTQLKLLRAVTFLFMSLLKSMVVLNWLTLVVYECRSWIFEAQLVYVKNGK